MSPHRRIDVVLDSVKRLQRIGATANLLNLLQKQHPADLAEVLSDLPDRERRSVFDTLFERNSRLAMEALSELEPEVRVPLLVEHPAEELSRVLQDLPPDDAAALIAAACVAATPRRSGRATSTSHGIICKAPISPLKGAALRVPDIRATPSQGDVPEGV